MVFFRLPGPSKVSYSEITFGRLQLVLTVTGRRGSVLSVQFSSTGRIKIKPNSNKAKLRNKETDKEKNKET